MSDFEGATLGDLKGLDYDDPIVREIAGQLFRHKRMQESLAGFCETIQIPMAPVRDGDWLEKALEVDSDEDEPAFPEAGLTLADHHRLLCNEIESCMTTDYGRLMVFMPPGGAKSTYGTVTAPTWAMGKWPGLQIITASYATPIAKKLGGRGRMVCDQEIYQGCFNTMIDPKTQAKELWGLTNGSNYMSGGLLSGLTGNRAGGVVIDDPVKGRQAANSKIERERTLDAYEDDLRTRMIPKAWMILIMTRWALEDLAGSILPKDWAGESGDIEGRDGMMWRVLNLPAKAYLPDDPLGRKPGEYLWPEWFDEKHWMQYEPKEGEDNQRKIKTWSSLFQGRPRADEGNLFEEEWFNRYDLGDHPPALNCYTASDYATVEDEGDFTEHGVWGLDNQGGLWALDWFFGQVTTDVGLMMLMDLAEKWKVKYGFGEKGIIRQAIEPAFLEIQKKRQRKLHITYLHPSGSKGSRVYAFQAKVHSGQVWIPRCPWGDRLIEQLCAFPSAGINDDGVDVCSLIGRGLQKAKWSSQLVAKDEPRGLKPFTWEWLTHEENKPKAGNGRIKEIKGRVM